MKRIATLLVGLALLLPAAATAQGGSTCQAYNPQLCAVGGDTGARPGVSAPYSYGNGGGGDTGWLPFTGLDLALLVATAGGLLGAGLLVRRLSRPNRVPDQA